MAVKTLPTKKAKVASSKIRGGALGSIEAVKAALKKGGGGNGQFIKKIPKDDVLTVRFLTDPDQWFGYHEVFDPAVGFSRPMLDGEQATGEQNTSYRFLVNALDVTNDRVIPLQLPRSLGESLFRRYEKYDTLTDRDYDLSRSGDKLTTVYDYDPGDKEKRNIDKYELLDLGDVLEQAAEDGQAGGSAKTATKATSARKAASVDEDEALPAPKKAAAPKLRRKVVEPEPELDDEEEDELEEEEEIEEDVEDEEEDDDDVDGVAPILVEDDDEDEFLTEADLGGMTLKALKELAEEYDVDSTGLSKAKLIEAILDVGEE